MRNLWIFVSKYNAFFLFLIFFAASLILIFRSNSYQRAMVVNSSNEMVGKIYEQTDQLNDYLTLRKTNDSLLTENLRLRSQLKSSFVNDGIEQRSVYDSLTRQQYTYVVARVVNNSIHQKNNFITINRGAKQGIAKGMGVISPSEGIVGFVTDVSDNYARIQSLLHSNTMVSASLTGSKAYGSLVWGEESFDPRKAKLQDIPNHIIIKTGEKVVTSGFSHFPAGLPIGKVLGTGLKRGSNFLDIDVALNTDFSTLQYVYVVINLRAAEQQQLEGQTKENE